jgi:hypothetical protein
MGAWLKPPPFDNIMTLDLLVKFVAPKSTSRRYPVANLLNGEIAEVMITDRLIES